MARKSKLRDAERWFFALILIVLVLATLNVAKASGYFIPEQPGIQVKAGVIPTVELHTLSLDQKIAQMIIVSGSEANSDVWKKMQPGGVHLFARSKEEQFTQLIDKYQQDMQVPFFVTVDLEGCLNPFANFKQFPAAVEIATPDEAFRIGTEQGKFLKSVGVNLNFAPVVDLKDQIWRCRSFPGDEKEVTLLANAYLKGLQEQGVIATAKHYPGKTLVTRDPHKYLVTATIDNRDLFPYSELAKDVDGIMVSHLITSGAIDSRGIPSVASPQVIGTLKQRYDGLVISDEINMLGLKDFYPTLDEMYLAVFIAGNDIILNFNEDPNEIYRMIQVVKKGVEQGDIPESQIDASVTKILKAKGFMVER